MFSQNLAMSGYKNQFHTRKKRRQRPQVSGVARDGPKPLGRWRAGVWQAGRRMNGTEATNSWTYVYMYMYIYIML